MKILAIIFVFCISAIYYGVSQTAEEIITETEEVYRNMKNYVDEGEVIEFRYADWRNVLSKDHTETKKYVTAHDDSQNVYHFIRRDNQEAYGADYSYYKSGENEFGDYKRIYSATTEMEYYPLIDASARLVASGGAVLLHSVGLHYPEMFAYQSKTMLRQYSTADRLKDTMINGAPCFVIELYLIREITQEFIDQVQYSRDSTNNANGTFYDYGDDMKPHTYKFYSTLFIRQQDNLIVRRHHYNLNDNNEKKLHHAVLMNPQINVDHFEKYLAEKK